MSLQCDTSGISGMHVFVLLKYGYFFERCLKEIPFTVDWENICITGLVPHTGYPLAKINGLSFRQWQ